MLCLIRTPVQLSTNSQMMCKRMYKKMTTKPGYISLQGEILYGVHPVHMALAARRRTVHCLYYNKSSGKTEEVVKICEEQGIPYRHLDRQALTDMCRQADKYKEHHVHQGLVLDVSKLHHYPMDYSSPQITSEPPPPPPPPRPAHAPPPVWLLLCGIKDPYNLGSIVRTAYFLGVTRVVVTGVKCDLTCTVSKASAGTLELVPVYAVRHPVQLLGGLVSEGWRVLATVMPGGDKASMIDTCTVNKLTQTCPTVLVLGSEGAGIPPEVLECVTQGVYIPPGIDLDNQVDSLNVSVAAAIVLQKLCS